MAEHHELMGGKLHVYKRENSRHWQCSTYLGGKNRRITTKEESLSHAKEIAEDWYLELRGKARAGQLTSGPTFKRAADQFLEEYETITNGQRSKTWVDAYRVMLRVHLLPFFGKLALTEINPGKLQEYRSLRHTYICFRLMEGADIYQIAKNCRTSVEMIEKFYAAHIKTTLDAASINVRKGVIERERKTRRPRPN
jgi:hypothetical protein